MLDNHSSRQATAPQDSTSVNDPQAQINQAVQAFIPVTSSKSTPKQPTQSSTPKLDTQKINTQASQIPLSATALQEIYEDPRLPKKIKPVKKVSIAPLIKYTLIGMLLFGVGLIAGLAAQLLLYSVS